MRRKLAGTLCIFLVLLLSMASTMVSPALAQEEDPSVGAACKSCHEDQYWRYDTGKWYCQCGKQRMCTDCHGGDATTWDVNLAHEGLVANPIADSPDICTDCHPEDYQARIEKFAAVAGIDLDATPEPNQVIYAAADINAKAAPISSLLEVQPAKGWKIASLGIIVLLLSGVTFLGYRCWRAECLPKLHQK